MSVCSWPAGGAPFKAIAYEKVYRFLLSYPAVITDAKQVAKEKGVGKGSLAKVRGKPQELESTGTSAYALNKLTSQALMAYPQLGFSVVV